jgi:putative chitinase
MPINRMFFFSQIRTSLFTNKLSQGQVDGMNAILDKWEDAHDGKDDRWLAYALGTAFHETAFTMQPIDEYGSDEYFEYHYGPNGKNPTRAKRMGNTKPGDGVLYHGRGLVQLTWKVNYAAMSKHLSQVTGANVDLVAEPHLAKQLDYATEIMFFGMENGTFTGKSFVNYFTVDGKGQPVKDDWVGARAIINRNDHDIDIARYGQKFYAAITYTH